MQASGNSDSLLQECHSIQQHLPSSAVSTAVSSGQMAHRFAKLMMEGKLRAAPCLIADNAENYLIALNSRIPVAGAKTFVRGVLLGKYPPSHLPKPSVLVSPSTTSSAPPSIQFYLIV